MIKITLHRKLGLCRALFFDSNSAQTRTRCLVYESDN